MHTLVFHLIIFLMFFLNISSDASQRPIPKKASQKNIFISPSRFHIYIAIIGVHQKH